MLTIVKAGCGKSARPVWEADGGQRRKVRLLRPDSDETGEQTRPTGRGAGGAKEEDRGEHRRATHAPDSESGKVCPRGSTAYAELLVGFAVDHPRWEPGA